MTEIEKDLNLMLLKLCEKLLPKTKVAEDLKIMTTMKKLRKYLGQEAARPSSTDSENVASYPYTVRSQWNTGN
jgi:hypothetical protein